MITARRNAVLFFWLFLHISGGEYKKIYLILTKYVFDGLIKIQFAVLYFKSDLIFFMEGNQP